MKKLQNIGKKLLYPPVWVVILLAAVSAVALAAVFVMGWEDVPMAYAAYLLSFYALTVVCALSVEVFPRYYRAAKNKINSTSFGGRFMSDAAFRTHVSLYVALLVNIMYAAVNILSGILYRSVWFYMLAGYYIILALMRFLLLRFVGVSGIGKDRIAELKRSRVCAMILLSVNLVLSASVLMILYRDKGYEYHGAMIYVMAMYTFYAVTHSIINLVKYRRYNSPVMSSARVISLSAALVSMLALETAMFAEFGADTSPEFRRLMIMLTGAGVSAAIIAMAVYMTVKANAEIKRSNKR